MKTRPGQKIKLAPVSELLGITNEESAMDIEIEKIRPFRNHPFKVLDDDKMQNLVESIQSNGILSPVLIRPIGNDIYEMVSGHRRMHAAKLLEMERIPAIIREMTDEEAIVNMVDSNIQREELLPSEKAFAYKMKLDAMKRQGLRNDLTSGQNGQKMTGIISRDLLAKEFGESSKQIQRFIRLTELFPPLLDYVDQKRLQFTVAVEISYIDPEIQKWLFEYVKEKGYINRHQATFLRNEVTNGPITREKMFSLLDSFQPDKASNAKLTFNKKNLQNYFPENYTLAQMQQIIENLLSEWKRNRSESFDTVRPQKRMKSNNDDGNA